MKRFKYNDGDIINGILMIKRLDKRKSCWYGMFKCPLCGTLFETQINRIKSGATQSCGCLPVGKKSKNYPDNGYHLEGQRFTRWTVLKRSLDEKRKGKYWICQCDCGVIKILSTQVLIKGESKSCGCLAREKASNRFAKDISQQHFGKLIAIEPTDKRNSSGSIVWKTQCECGQVKYVSVHDLTTGNVKSCGCLVSYGEERIKQILTTQKIDFISQKTFPTCRMPDTQKVLRFDFYLPDYQCCIEYDGQQHFYAGNGWNNPEQLARTKYRDSFKNKWCHQNNINLIRIPYTDLKQLSTKYLMQKLAERRDVECVKI